MIIKLISTVLSKNSFVRFTEIPIYLISLSQFFLIGFSRFFSLRLFIQVETKSVQQCVEFYYLWKAMHPESFRARTRMVEVESEQVKIIFPLCSNSNLFILVFHKIFIKKIPRLTIF